MSNKRFILGFFYENHASLKRRGNIEEHHWLCDYNFLSVDIEVKQRSALREESSLFSSLLHAVDCLCIDIMCLISACRCNTLSSKVNNIWHLHIYTRTHIRTQHAHAQYTQADYSNIHHSIKSWRQERYHIWVDKGKGGLSVSSSVICTHVFQNVCGSPAAVLVVQKQGPELRLQRLTLDGSMEVMARWKALNTSRVVYVFLSIIYYTWRVRVTDIYWHTQTGWARVR